MCWIYPSPFPQLHMAARAHHVLLCLHVLAHICPSPIQYQNHTFQETKKPGRRTDYMSVRNPWVCNESSLQQNSRGSNSAKWRQQNIFHLLLREVLQPNAQNPSTEVLPEVKKCNSFCLSNLRPWYKKAWKLFQTQHDSCMQKGWDQKKDWSFLCKWRRQKKNSRRQRKRRRKDRGGGKMLTSIWLRHAEVSHQCSPILTWESRHQRRSACVVVVAAVAEGRALLAPYPQRWNGAPSRARRCKDLLLAALFSYRMRASIRVCVLLRFPMQAIVLLLWGFGSELRSGALKHWR